MPESIAIKYTPEDAGGCYSIEMYPMSRGWGHVSLCSERHVPDVEFFPTNLVKFSFSNGPVSISKIWHILVWSKDCGAEEILADDVEKEVRDKGNSTCLVQ